MMVVIRLFSICVAFWLNCSSCLFDVRRLLLLLVRHLILNMLDDVQLIRRVIVS